MTQTNRDFQAGKISGLEIAVRQVERVAADYFIAGDDETARVIRDLAVWIRGEQEFVRNMLPDKGEAGGQP